MHTLNPIDRGCPHAWQPTGKDQANILAVRSSPAGRYLGVCQHLSGNRQLLGMPIHILKRHAKSHWNCGSGRSATARAACQATTHRPHSAHLFLARRWLSVACSRIEPMLANARQVGWCWSLHASNEFEFQTTRSNICWWHSESVHRTHPLHTQVAWRNALQRAMMEKSRLQIPVAFSNEALHSAVPGGTVFPELVSQGTTCVHAPCVCSLLTSLVRPALRTHVFVVRVVHTRAVSYTP